jgi:hypothetical protein
LISKWTLRRERARYEAERARRQYDTVEPENRVVTRSLERAWEGKLRAVEAIEQEYSRWRSAEPVVMSEAERAALQKLGENLPRIWRADTTSAEGGGIEANRCFLPYTYSCRTTLSNELWTLN